MNEHKDCASGYKREGMAEGSVEKFGSWDVYVARPEGDYGKERAILFFTGKYESQTIPTRRLPFLYTLLGKMDSGRS